MQHAIHFQNGIVHYSTTDAVFRDVDGTPVTMEFHSYLGPFFSRNNWNDGGFIPEEDSPLWKQFYGWWNAKGKKTYDRS